LLCWAANLSHQQLFLITLSLAAVVVAQDQLVAAARQEVYDQVRLLAQL
jgi:hypothetical protein